MLSGEHTADWLQLANISPWVPRMGFLRSPLPRRRTEKALSVFLCSFWQMAVDSCLSINAAHGADSLTHQAARHRAASSGAKKKSARCFVWDTARKNLYCVTLRCCGSSPTEGIILRSGEISVAPRYRDAFSENVVGFNLVPGGYRSFRADTNIGEENGRVHQPISISIYISISISVVHGMGLRVNPEKYYTSML